MLQFAVDVLTLLDCNAALFNKGIEHFLRLFASDGHSANACQENIAETLFEFSSHDDPSISANRTLKAQERRIPPAAQSIETKSTTTKNKWS